jgi:anti-sigma factor RsiW
MEHSYIEEHNIVDRYLLGKLSVEERVRFEEHLADCMQCLDHVETSDDFRTVLRVVVVE